MWIVPSDQYLFLPDTAHPVAPLVRVKGGKDPTGPGQIYYDAVIVRRAKLFEKYFSWVHDGATLVPASVINPPGESDSQRRAQDLREMAQSQNVAPAVALKYLGYNVKVGYTGALVEEIVGGGPAEKAGIQPTEVIVSVDGKPVRRTTALRSLMSGHKPGDTVRLGVRGAKGIREVAVRTVADPHNPKRAVIGVLVGQASQATLPFPVTINAGSIGGPSAGLAFALDILEELGHRVDRGYKVAATGEIFPDGTVGPIGGVKQKTIGARRAGVDVFLVPAGDNAQEARKYAGSLRIIPVESFQQALRVLATLPPKS